MSMSRATLRASALGNLLSIDIRVRPSSSDSNSTVKLDGPSSTGTSFASTIASRRTSRYGGVSSPTCPQVFGRVPSRPLRGGFAFSPRPRKNPVVFFPPTPPPPPSPHPPRHL